MYTTKEKLAYNFQNFAKEYPFPMPAIPLIRNSMFADHDMLTYIRKYQESITEPGLSKQNAVLLSVSQGLLQQLKSQAIEKNVPVNTYIVNVLSQKQGA